MNYIETYELRTWNETLADWIWIDAFDNEAEAVRALDRISVGPGRWRVVRVSEVTLRTVVRAK